MLKDTLTRHEAFWQQKSTDRPLLAVNVGFFVNQRFPRVMEAMPEEEITPEDIPVEKFLKDCDDLHESHAGLGDYPFVSAPFVGIPWMEAIAGCPIMASKSSFWAEPCITDWKTWQWAESDLDNPWTKKLIELMTALVEHSHGRYGVAPTLMRGPSDILSAMRGAAELSLDLMDDPDAVLPNIERAADLWKTMARVQHDLIPESNEGYVAGDAALRTWSPEKVLWLQEDAMSLLSPRLYKDFFLPVDRKLSSEFPCIAYHLHGSALWAIDDLLLLPGVDVIELNLEDAACDIEGTFAGWKQIQEHKPCIMWRAYGKDFKPWIERVLREYPAKGLSIQVSASNSADAKLAQTTFFEAVAAFCGRNK